MSVKVHLLLGGLTQYGDGYVTSVGMYSLAAQLRGIGATVTVYPWADELTARRDVLIDEGGGKIALIGYSGGGSRATWIANQEPRPIIDLMVLYDPSPRWQISPIPANAKRVICYQNSMPLMFGLGGGVAVGPTVETVPIAEQHLLVQFDQSLHSRTVAAVKGLV